ncbi:MAG: UDP-N-acetylmuramate--L-alanine ligase [Chthoniobacterales bacterium]
MTSNTRTTIPFPLSEAPQGAPKKIHLIGVAGSGMSGIASLLLALGHKISGSDRVTTQETERLSKKGLDFHLSQSAKNITGKDLVIYSSAVGVGNAEFDEAKRLGIPLIRRAEALANLMNSRKGIIICGMHGKTTTSSMAAYALSHAELKPSHYIGAEIPILGANARWDSEGDYFVAEGDESDGTLVNYHPEHCILLNIEPEHLDFYRDLDAINAVFNQLLDQTKGKIIYCSDDPGATHLAKPRPNAISYGHNPEADFRITDLRHESLRPRFRVWKKDKLLGEVELGVPGDHNALNALAVIALGLELGVAFEPLAKALSEFRGAKRRFETKYKDEYNVIIDDYGHHPTEIEATLKTARSGPWQRIHLLFQPHRYTRTQALQEQFGHCFSGADKTFITSIYPASEQAIEGVDGSLLVAAAQRHGNPDVTYEPDLASLHQKIGPHIEDGDLILTLGAGNIHEVAPRIATDLACRAQLRKIMGPGEIRLHEPLSKHTTMRVGGPARFWVEPETEAGFTDLVRYCFDQEIPFMAIGRGSNLLVRDGGFPGVVAHLVRGDFSKIALEGNEITAGVGIRLKQLVGFARKAGLGGFEWMEGIPGNLGGSLRMNAGAMGRQTFEQVRRIRYCDRDGNIFSETPEQIEVHYRNVPMLADHYALSAILAGTPADADNIDRKIKEAEKKRKTSQPIAASAGCIFKNPETIPAGKLVEELGLKNTRIGAARVSDVHGNFIVNDGDASAGDILQLIEKIQAAAKKERGIDLQTEVQIIGEPS